MSAPQLGQPVTFTHSLHRRTVVGGTWPRVRKAWVSRPAGTLGHTTTKDGLAGVVVGVRTLANGEVYHHDWDGSPTFRPTEHVTAYLVAYDVRRKPVYVLPEHCTLEVTP